MAVPVGTAVASAGTDGVLAGAPAARTDLQVDVLICAYTADRWEDVRAAIAALRAQTRPATRIVLAIDHNDRLYERAVDEFGDCLVVRNTEQRGLSGARNSAIRACPADDVERQVLVFLDDDAVPEPEWLAGMVAPIEADDRVMVVGGRAVAAWDGGRPGWWPEEFDWAVGCSYRGLPTSRAEVRNAIGCAAAFRGNVFRLVGDFTSGIGRVGADAAGGEETELQIRLRQAAPAAVILYEPAAVVHHRVPAARARWSYLRRRCWAEGRSKALISGLVGSDDALSSERAYVRSVLPRGVVRALGCGLRGDLGGFGRAAAIVAAVGSTTVAYGWTTLRRRFRLS
jgi:GT2 family glycosyltransferase